MVEQSSGATVNSQLFQRLRIALGTSWISVMLWQYFSGALETPERRVLIGSINVLVLLAMCVDLSRKENSE